MGSIFGGQPSVAQAIVDGGASGKDFGGLGLALDGAVEDIQGFSIPPQCRQGEADSEGAAVVVRHAQFHQLAQLDGGVYISCGKRDARFEAEGGALVYIGCQNALYGVERSGGVARN